MTVESKTCECVKLRQPGGFSGWNDYNSFLDEVRNTQFLTEVAVENPLSNVGLIENWYKCGKCGTKWRLVEPDPPFGGAWKRVNP